MVDLLNALSSLVHTGHKNLGELSKRTLVSASSICVGAVDAKNNEGIVAFQAMIADDAVDQNLQVIRLATKYIKAYEHHVSRFAPIPSDRVPLMSMIINCIKKQADAIIGRAPELARRASQAQVGRVAAEGVGGKEFGGKGGRTADSAHVVGHWVWLLRPHPPSAPSPR